jgi:hypothetical protein
MKISTKTLSLALLVSLILVLVPAQPVESAGEYRPKEDSIVSDAFGYLLNPSAPFVWNDIAGSGQFIQMGDDDNAVNMRSMGFSFPFYENHYSQVYISIDGVLYLGSTAPPVTINIRPLPFESPPNAIIAPFWEDLALVLDTQHNDGQIWVKYDGESPNRTFTVQWNNVYRLGSGTPLTFQAVIKETGDIVFNYQSVGDIIPEIPIGIEDPDGIDGLQYIYGTDELTSGKSIYITRPGPGARLKAFPVFQGGFMEAQWARFDVTVRNTGTIDDNYLLSYEIISGNPAWEIHFLDSSLQEINATGIIQAEHEAGIIVVMNSSFAPVAGDYARVRIKFQSTVDAAKSFSVTIQGAVPSEFAKVQIQEFPALSTSVLFRSQASGQLKFIPAQSRDDLAIMRIGGGKYIVASDNENSGDSSNIEFTFTDTSLNTSHITFFITDNSLVGPGDSSTCEQMPEMVRDLAPAMAITPDGNIGIVFIRERLKKVTSAGGMCVERMNSNIWFATVKTNGVHRGPFQITQNTSYGTQQMQDIDFYTSPTIAATADNRFTLTWSRRKTIADSKEVRDIYMTNLSMADLAAGAINPPLQLTHGEMEHQRYYDPVITSLRGGGSALVASVYKTDWMEYYFRIYTLDNYGSITEVTALERGMQGVRPDILQLRNGNLLMAYTTPDNRGIGYALITPDKTVYRCQLPLTGGDSLDYVSITTDPAGNGVLTWAERLTNKHYYTLIAPNPPPESNACVLLTPPMIYGRWPVGGEQRSHYNQHSTIAPLGSPNLFVPLIGQ